MSLRHVLTAEDVWRSVLHELFRQDLLNLLRTVSLMSSANGAVPSVLNAVRAALSARPRNILHRPLSRCAEMQ